MSKGFSEEGQERAIAAFYERRAQQDHDKQMEERQRPLFTGSAFLGGLSLVLFVVIVYHFIKALWRT